MVPLESLSLEHKGDYHSEDSEGNDFLDDLELHQVERTSVVNESDSVGRNLSAVLEECHRPREEYDQNQWLVR